VALELTQYLTEMSTRFALTMHFFYAWPKRSHYQSIHALLNYRCCCTNAHIIHYFFLFHTLHWDDLPVVVVVVVVVVVCCLQLTINYRNKNSVSMTTPQLKKEQRALPKPCVHRTYVRKVTASRNTIISCHLFSYLTNAILQNNYFGEPTHTYAGAVVIANLCL